MIIERIDIKSFGKLENLSLEFSETVNVIEGQNEAGKSTIASFIKYMLFGFDTRESEDSVSERRKRINWTSGVAEGSMLVRVGDKRYLITRSTTPTSNQAGRPSYKEDSSIIDMETGAPAFGKQAAGEVFFGANRELFENTAFIGRIGDAGIDEGSVKESIENILFSGSERINNQRAMSRISDKMETLIHKGGQGGIIFDLTKKRDELDARLTQSDEDNKQILAKETELWGIKRERLDAEDKLNKLYDLDSCYKNVMLIQTFDRLHELEEDSSAKNQAYNAYVLENTRSGFAPTDEYLAEFSYARKAESDAERAYGEAEAKYAYEKNAVGITKEIESNIATADNEGGEEQILKRAASFFGKTVRGILYTTLGSLTAIGSLVCLLLIKHIAATVGFASLGAISLGFASLSLAGALRNKKRLGALASKFSQSTYSDLKGKIAVIEQARAKRDGMIRSTEEARLLVQKTRIEYDNARSELSRVVSRWSCDPETPITEEYLDTFARELNEYLDKKRELLEEKNTTELTVREIRRTLSDKNEIDIRAQVSPLKRKALSRINHDEIITGIAAYKAKIVEQDKLAYSVENELALLKARAGDPGDMYSRLSRENQRIKELREKHKAYFVAEKAIECATDNLRSGISPRLGEYSTALMGIMTDKKYRDFDISSGLKVSYLAEGGEQRSVDFLSGGTRDLAYISVRMALIDMLYTELPPLVFDESFANQDNQRARSMMRACAFLASEGYQTFIFTCRQRESTLAKELTRGAEIFKLTDGTEE